MLPYLSCGSEIVHPIVEQSDEQMTNDNSVRFNHQDLNVSSIVSPLLSHRENENISSSSNSNSNHDSSLDTERFRERYLRYYFKFFPIYIRNSSYIL